MNKHLQTVLNSIQQSKDLSADDKNTISIALQNVDDELNHKTRDLEIEASLERVRTVALGMRKPDDLLSICKILYSELIFLGFIELRNTMINIHNDDAASFLNYDYSDAAGATVTTILYNSHPATENLVKQIKKPPDV
jgi:hypothetical protein